jgi:acyl dehydratase
MPAIWYDDHAVGDVIALGSTALELDEIVAFARRYDPQPFHVDPAAAAAGPYGDIIASGWHTAAACMRLIVEGLFGPDSGSLGSPGLSELSWKKPVRPGDTLTLSAEVLEKIPSRSKPDRGFWRMRFAAVNQHGEEVLVMVPMQYLRRRPGNGPAGAG